MGRMMPRIAATGLLALSLLLAPLAGPAPAAAVQSYLYHTAGDIAGTSGTAPGLPIRFEPQGTAMMSTPGGFALGTILTNPLPSGATLTFDGTDFTVKLALGPVPAGGTPEDSLASNPFLYTIHGVLNGSIRGDGTSSLFATVTSVLATGGMLPFPASSLTFLPQGIAAPNGSTPGSTTLTARVDAAGLPIPDPVPEPTPAAAFAAALAVWAWRRRRAASA